MGFILCARVGCFISLRQFSTDGCVMANWSLPLQQSVSRLLKIATKHERVVGRTLLASLSAFPCHRIVYLSLCLMCASMCCWWKQSSSSELAFSLSCSFCAHLCWPRVFFSATQAKSRDFYHTFRDTRQTENRHARLHICAMLMEKHPHAYYRHHLLAFIHSLFFSTSVRGWFVF